MTKRLKILENSLVKKDRALSDKFENHFIDVKSANGQPLNDKRNGQATLGRWGRQNESIRSAIDGVEITKAAIEREKSKINYVEFWYKKMPEYLTDLIDNGEINQWRKHPRMMFVSGVDKARLVFNDETGLVNHRYVSDIKDKQQFAIFRDLFNQINKIQNNITASQEAKSQ